MVMTMAEITTITVFEMEVVDPYLDNDHMHVVKWVENRRIPHRRFKTKVTCLP